MLQALRKLRSDWDMGNWEGKDGDWFPTPGLVITAPGEKQNGSETDVTVQSVYAVQIGQMIRSVRNALLDDLDYYDQEELYRRMGSAAAEEIERNGDRDQKKVLEAVLREAETVYEDWSRYLIFLYGDEMDESVIRTVCPTAKFYGKGTADGYRPVLDTAGHLTLVPDSETAAEGLLWMLTQEEMILLEQYENGDEERFRKRTLVVQAGEELLSAQTYISVLERSDTAVPDIAYEKTCRFAKKNGMSAEYISRLEILGSEHR